MMQAILHGKKSDGGSGRGRPPKSIAAKYTSPGKDASETSGKNTGGNWSEEHHAKAKDKVKADRKERKKDKKNLKKSFEDNYRGHAAATIVMNEDGDILIGKHHTGGLGFPGGHMDDADLMDHEITALRELKEEAGITGRNPNKIWEGKSEGNHVQVYLIESFKGKPKSSKELSSLRWVNPKDIDYDKLRPCCVAPLKHFITNKLGKSLEVMLILEKLEKNIVRQKASAVLEVTHGDALRLVGNGLFRKLQKEVKSMTDEDFKDIKLDTYVVSIRKHMTDVYSGRVNDGHKMVYQFTNKSLPELTAALMSVFEWYLPEDQAVLDTISDESLDDDYIEGGLNVLTENYKRHNIGNIYEEMETIREQIRNGVAVDLQQVESRILKLFEKLQNLIQTVSNKHNKLARDAGDDIDDLENKLRELQNKIESMENKPNKIEAYSSNPANQDKVHEDYYPYLSRPSVEILPNGKMTILFKSDWEEMEKSNFLHDLRAKVIKKVGN